MSDPFTIESQDEDTNLISTVRKVHANNVKTGYSRASAGGLIPLIQKGHTSAEHIDLLNRVRLGT